MIVPPTVAPLWGILEGDVWGALKSLKFIRGSIDSPAYCRPSLGLGNTAGAEILEGDGWRALKSQRLQQTNDSRISCRPSLGLGNTAGAEILEGDVWRALKIEQTHHGLMLVPPTVGPLWGPEIEPEM